MRWILIIFCFSIISGCEKDEKPDCEKWQIYETCEPKSPQVSCSPRDPDVEMNICGDALKDAHSGKPTIITDDANTLRKRFYMKKVN